MLLSALGIRTIERLFTSVSCASLSSHFIIGLVALYRCVELVRLWGVVHVGTAVASWRQHLPTGKRVAQDAAVTRAATQTDPEEPHPVQGRHCQTDTQTLQPIQQQHEGQHQLQEMQRMQKQQQQMVQQYDALICFISINFIGSEKRLSRELLKSKRRYESRKGERGTGTIEAAIRGWGMAAAA